LATTKETKQRVIKQGLEYGDGIDPCMYAGDFIRKSSDEVTGDRVVILRMLS
jgi:hypothetical protein